MWVGCLRQYSALWYMLFKPYTYGHVTSSSVQYSTVQYSTVQYSTVRYGVRILSVRTTKAVDKVREAVIYSLCQTSVCFLEHLGQNLANFV